MFIAVIYTAVFLLGTETSAPRMVLRRSLHRLRPPCARFTSALATTRASLGPVRVSLLLHRDGLPPSTFAGLAGAPAPIITSDSCTSTRPLLTDHFIGARAPSECELLLFDSNCDGCFTRPLCESTSHVRPVYRNLTCWRRAPLNSIDTLTHRCTQRTLGGPSIMERDMGDASVAKRLVPGAHRQSCRSQSP